MRRIKVVKQKEVHKDFQRILGPLEQRVRGMVVDILSDVETNLAAELHGVGLEAMQAVMELEILEVAGPKGRHLDDRRYHRWGSNPGSVVINGTKVPCQVPRVVEEATHKALSVKSYGLFRQSGELLKRAYRDLIRGISTRRFAEGVDAFIEGYGLSASTLSRHMKQAATRKVEELYTRSLAEVDLAVLMIDGVEMGDYTVVIALGIDSKGVKHVLGLRQGATENADVCKALLEDMLERGISFREALLVVIDGAKALRKAVNDVFAEKAIVQRCTVHKKRNVLKHLADKDRAWVSRRMSQAYDLSDHDKARTILLALADQLQRINPDAARSLLEALDETLTVQRLGLPDLLRLSLRSTNIIESANNGVRDRSRNVKRWRDGAQTERWTAAGLLETEKGFRRIKGYKQLPVLMAALEKETSNKTQAA